MLAIVRKDLYDRIGKSVPKIFSFKAHRRGEELLNTPPTFGIYILLEIFRWLERQGGLAAMEKRNAAKAKLIYDAIDGSGGFYKGTVADKAARSHMNVTFRLPSEELTDEFVKEAAKNGMVALKGYRTVGGIRARSTTPCRSKAARRWPTSWGRSPRPTADRAASAPAVRSGTG